MKKNWYAIGALILLVWGLVNTTLLIVRYGVDQGLYFWFCNLALLGTAYGLWKRNRGFLLSLLAVASFTQVFWIMDNVWRVVTESNFLGVVEFMYQPGFLMDQFIVSHYHYFVIPVTVLALCFLPRQKSYWVYLILALNVLVFGISFWAFPKEQNVNCVHESCLGFVSVNGLTYTLGFFVLILLGNLGAAWGLGKCFPIATMTAERKKRIQWVFVGVCAVGVILTAVDMAYKASLPSFRCQPPFEGQTIRAACKFTEEYSEGMMKLVYTLENKLSKPQVCSSYLDLSGDSNLLHREIYIEPDAELQIPVLLSYPEKDVWATLSASCLIDDSYSGRKTPKLPE